jgi:tetrahydrodipicolinate N-succinyltransferase
MQTTAPGVDLSRHAVVAAPALVTRGVPAEIVVAGVPATAVCSARDIKCNQARLEHVYPWPGRHFTCDHPKEALADAGV